jgi:hypothetical protein
VQLTVKFLVCRAAKFDVLCGFCSVIYMSTLNTAMPEAYLQNSTAASDEVSECVGNLESLLPAGTDTELLVDFLADDLREGLMAVAEIETHFHDVLDALGDAKLSPMRLVEVAEDFKVLNRLEYVMVVAAQLRKRLSQAAGKLASSR